MSTALAKLGRALGAAYLHPVPAERLALLRVLVAGFATVYLVVRAPVLADFRSMSAERFEPVLLTRVLEGPVAPALAFGVLGACVLACLAFALGAFARVSGPLAALLLWWVTSYRNSFGMIFHTDNLLVFHLAVLALVPRQACASLSLDARHGRVERAARPGPEFGWPMVLIAAVTAAAYVLAGVAKLKLSGFDWASGEILRNHIAYDAVRKAAVGSIYSPLGGWLVQYSAPFPLIGVVTLVLELGAPLALCSRRLGQAWALGIWCFHAGVLALMAIAFVYPLSGVAFAAFFELERLLLYRPVRRVVSVLFGPLVVPSPVE